MANVEMALSIFASALSIYATVIGLRNRNDIKKMRDEFNDVRQSATGNGNAQVVGSGNKVTTHGR